MGPILEKTVFDLMVDEVKPQAETIYARTILFMGNTRLKPKGPERKVLEGFMSDTARGKLTFFLRDYVKSSKEVPLYFTEETLIAHVETGAKTLSEMVEGPAGEREIIFKPTPPTIPRGVYGDRAEYMIKLKFFISDNGIVYDAEPVFSSGYPEIDLQAIRFLGRWRFFPLGLAEKNTTIWGIVTIRIEAK